MKQIFIIANWKSYKTSPEAFQWLEEMKKQNLGIVTDKETILCAPFTLLAQLNWFIKENNLSIKLGAQNVSSFGEGAYTGEVNSKQLKEYVTYSIIGHSERRRFLGETDELLSKKVSEALKQDIIPIYCVQSSNEPIPDGVEIVAYEPASAIGSGNPDTPESAVAVSATIRQKYPFVKSVLYGGSVTPENVSSFTSQNLLDGVLVGGASLDPLKFFQIIKNA